MIDDFCGNPRPHPTHMVPFPTDRDPYLCRGVERTRYSWQSSLYWIAAACFLGGIAVMGFAGPFLVAGIFVSLGIVLGIVAETVF